MKNELSVSISEVELIERLSRELFKSGIFESKNPSEVFAKILAGREIGVGPFASITGIHFFQGKPTMGSNLIATLISKSLIYSYRILQLNNSICEIEFFEKKESVGKCQFTIEEATKAGLTIKDVWKKYPSDLLFARCISRGSRRFASGIFGGSPIYTPEELNLDIDDDGRVIDSEPIKEQKIENLASTDQIIYFHDLCKELNITPDQVKNGLDQINLKSIEELKESSMKKWILDLESRRDNLNSTSGEVK